MLVLIETSTKQAATMRFMAMTVSGDREELAAVSEAGQSVKVHDIAGKGWLQ